MDLPLVTADAGKLPDMNPGCFFLYLELKVFEDRRDSIQLVSLVSSVVDPDTQEKIAVIRDRLMRQFGYDEMSAGEVLQHVAGLFARGEAKEPGAEAA